MPKCTFSGEELKPGTGIMYVKDDGKVLYFKNKKCEKAFLKLKRIPRETKWSQHYEK